MELTRKQVIEELQKMLDYYSIRQDSTPEREQALVYAISSLKTDETYQIMYEGGEIFTKADMVAMFTDIYEEISSVKTADIGEVIVKGECKNVIQKKINALEGGKE